MSKPPPHSFLGSPLPLPYKIHSFDEDETVVESKKRYVPIRPRETQRVISSDTQDVRDTGYTQFPNRTDRLDPPTPIRFSKARTSSSTAIIDTISQAIVQLESMDDVDPVRLAQIRDSVERLSRKIDPHTTSAELTELMIEASQKDSSSASYDALTPLSEEPNILDELLKIQATTRKTWNLQLVPRWVLGIFVIVIFFCLSSYMVSGLTYDYCYYLC